MELLPLTLLYLVADFITTAVCREYCQAQMFEPKCGPQEVILMTKALYGRMEKGKCNVEGKFETGCHNDVIGVMDQLCSGKRECSLQIPHKDLLDGYGCPGQLVGYLAAEYQCIHVFKCQSSLVQISNNPGYLMASAATGCVFQLEVKRGQQIELSSINLQTKRSSVCTRVKVAERMASSPVTEVFDQDICPNGVRHQSIYRSYTNLVKLQLSQTGSSQHYNSSVMLVHYKAVGCPDKHLYEGQFMVRDKDGVTVQCNSSNQAWHLVCRGTEWVGDTGQCQPDHSLKPTPQKSFFQLKNGVLLAVLIGVALGVLVGVLLLATYITIAKMSKRKYENPREYIYPKQPNPPHKPCDIEEMDYHVQRPPPDHPTAIRVVDSSHNAHLDVDTFVKSPINKCGVHVQL